MASRWVDSGIDWANLDLHKERTSWVIDELYRAFKERQSIYRFVKENNGGSPNVGSWDLLDSYRDTEKLNSIIIELQDWLTTDTTFSGGENNKAGWADHTVDSAGKPAVFQSNFRGVPNFNLAIGGNLENLIGVNLSPIRDWSMPVNYRIDSDLLNIIYKILINLKYVLPYKAANFGGIMTNFTTLTISASAQNWRSASSNGSWASRLSSYQIATPTVSSTEKDRMIYLISGAPSSGYVQQSANVLTFDNLRDSSNNIVSVTTTGTKAYKFNEVLSGDPTQYTAYTSNIFESDSLAGASFNSYPEPHPYSFTLPSTSQSDDLYGYTVPLINIDNSTVIQYYTP